MSAEITLDGVSKTFGDNVQALHKVDLAVADGEFLVIVGPSGCGKSTLLRLVAGLDEPTAGEISVGGRPVTGLSPRERDVSMVFQNYALYPHMTVAENMGFGLRLRRRPKHEIAERVRDAAAILGLEGLLERRPAALSGGQRQRVAMGRALVRHAQALLMDEPLSNLDAQLRIAMRGELRLLHRRIGTTTLYVTHDQVEAMTLGDRVAILRDGVLQQVATAAEVFDHPANLFVAAFMGSPAMNLIETSVSEGRLRLGPVEIPLQGRARSGPVVAGLRPGAFEDREWTTSSGLPELTVVPEVVEHLGDEKYALFQLPGELVCRPEDSKVGLPSALITARVNVRCRASVGSPLRLVVDPSRLHLFDPCDGRPLV